MPLAATDCHRADEVHRFGFSFVELLFAIAVLGIGFIMIAAVFPVGLQQTKITLNETAGAAGSRSMVSRLQKAAETQVHYDNVMATDVRAAIPVTMPYNSITTATTDVGKQFPGQVRTLSDWREFADKYPPSGLPAANTDQRRYSQWQAIADDLINPSDSRNASVVLVKRDAICTGAGTYKPASTAQVIVINTQVSNQPTYVKDDVSFTPTPVVSPVPQTTKQAIFNLEARPVAVQIVYDPSSGNYVASFFSISDLDGGTVGTVALDYGGYPKTGNSPSGSGTVTWDSVYAAALDSVGEGAFVVISDDRIVPPAVAGNPVLTGRLNGRTFRLGNRRTDLAGLTYDLAPGYGFTPDAGADGILNLVGGTASTDDFVCIGVDKNSTLLSNVTYGGGATVVKPFGTGGSSPANTPIPDGTAVTVRGTPAHAGAVALVVGRGFNNSSITPPGVAGNVSAYAGPVQDVSLYTTFVSVPNP